MRHPLIARLASALAIVLVVVACGGGPAVTVTPTPSSSRPAVVGSPSPMTGPGASPTLRPGVRVAACPLDTIIAAASAFKKAPFFKVTNTAHEDITTIAARTYLSYVGPDKLDLIVLNDDIMVASSIIAIGNQSWSMQLGTGWTKGGANPLGRPINQTAALLLDGWKLLPDESWDSVKAGDHCAYLTQDGALRVELSADGKQLAKLVERKPDGTFLYNYFDFVVKAVITAPLVENPSPSPSPLIESPAPSASPSA